MWCRFVVTRGDLHGQSMESPPIDTFCAKWDAEELAISVEELGGGAVGGIVGSSAAPRQIRKSSPTVPPTSFPAPRQPLSNPPPLVVPHQFLTDASQIPVNLFSSSCLATSQFIVSSSTVPLL